MIKSLSHYTTMPLPKYHFVLLFLFLVIIASPGHAFHQGFQTALAGKQSDTVDRFKTTVFKKKPNSRFQMLRADNRAHFLKDCIALLGNEALLSDRIILIRKVCARQLEALVEPIPQADLTKALTATEIRSKETSMKQSRKSRRLYRLLRRARKSTLQYIHSRFFKVLHFTIPRPDGSTAPSSSCSFAETPASDPGSQNVKQRKLARQIAKMLENADYRTQQDICKRLSNVFGNILWTSYESCTLA